MSGPDEATFSTGVPNPPFQRVWTKHLNGGLLGTAFDGHLGFFHTYSALSAVDLQSGRSVWESEAPTTTGFKYPLGGIGRLALADRSVYLLLLQRGKSILHEYDRKDGSLLWKKQVSLSLSPTVGHGLLYSPWTWGNVAALDLVSRRPIWKYRVRTSPAAETPPTLSGNKLILAQESGLVALDALTGCLRWATNEKAVVRAATEEIVVTSDQNREGLQVLSSLTGESLWHLPDVRCEVAIFDDAVLLYGDKAIRALSLQNGEPRWECGCEGRVRPFFPRERRSRNVGDASQVGNALLIARWLPSLYDKNGQRRWRSPELTGLTGLAADGNNLLMCEGVGMPEKLYCFQHEATYGDRPSEDPWDFTKGFPPNFNDLTPFEKQRLTKVGLRTVQRLLDFVQQPAASIDGLESAWWILQRVHGPEVNEAFRQTLLRCEPGSAARLELMNILGRRARSDEDRVDLIRLTPVDRWATAPEVMREVTALFGSTYGPAVDVLIDAFRIVPRDGWTWTLYFFALPRSGPKGVAEHIRIRECLNQPHRWPDVSRWAQSDAEKALEAAFFAAGIFIHAQQLQIRFPKGMEPFAMVGAPCVCITKSVGKGADKGSKILEIKLPAEFDVSAEHPEGTQICVDTILGPDERFPVRKSFRVRKHSVGWALVGILPGEFGI